jgi:hypothetical protein
MYIYIILRSYVKIDGIDIIHRQLLHRGSQGGQRFLSTEPRSCSYTMQIVQWVRRRFGQEGLCMSTMLRFALPRLLYVKVRCDRLQLVTVERESLAICYTYFGEESEQVSVLADQCRLAWNPSIVRP